MNMPEPASPSAPSRRRFLKIATVTAVGVVANRFGLRRASGADAVAAADEKPLYFFPLLGDLHYDKLAHHDMEWVRKEKPGDERQILNYAKVTETLTPRLLADVSAAVKAAPATVPFVVQVGDLVEGLCGSLELHATQFNDAFAAVDAAAFGVPFLMTKGNHDITGPGADVAYDQTLLPWLAGQGKQATFAGASYFRRQDEDLFVFFDGYKPDLAWLESTLKANAARHVFVVVHQPVVPYNARSNWGVFATASAAPQRQHLLTLLGEHRAIVLGGHLHKFSALTRTVGSTAFSQLAVSSVLRRADEPAKKDVLNGIETFGPSLVDLEPDFAPDSIAYRRELLSAEGPSITRFEYADVPGYAMVKVYPDRVDADVFASLLKDAWRTDRIDAKPREAKS